MAASFMAALGDGRDERGRPADRPRFGVMAGATAAVLLATVTIAAWPALGSAPRWLQARTAAGAGPTAGSIAARGNASSPDPARSNRGPAPGAPSPAVPAAPPPPGAPAQPVVSQPAPPAATAPPAAPVPATVTAAVVAPPAAAAAAPAVRLAAAPSARYPFEDGGTDGWAGHGHVTGLGSGGVAHDGARSLQVALHSTGPGDLPYVSVVVSGGSAPAPGQTLTAFLFVQAGSPAIQGKLFVQDTSFAWHMNGLVGLRQGAWTQLSLVVPAGVRVNQLGVQLLCSPANTNATVFVDSVSWS